jgi:hypothetical protein
MDLRSLFRVNASQGLGKNIFNYYTFDQCFPNFFDARTTKKILVLREAQNIYVVMDPRTL